MNRLLPRLAPCLLLALAACQPAAPIPADELGLELLLPPEPVTPGKPFPLTVVARWSKAHGDLASTLQLERAFPPLVLQLEGVQRREDGLRIEEARTYRAYAMTRGDVVLAPATWAPRPPTAPALRAATPRTTVRVRPEVDAADGLALEVPLPTLQAARPRWLGWAGMGLVVVLLLLEGWRLRQRRQARQAAGDRPGQVPGDVRALLEARAGQAPAAEVRALCQQVRQALAQAGLPAPSRTAAETLAAAPALGGAFAPGARGLAALTRLLQQGEAITYAAEVPSAAQAMARREDAAEVLQSLSTAAHDLVRQGRTP